MTKELYHVGLFKNNYNALTIFIYRNENLLKF